MYLEMQNYTSQQWNKRKTIMEIQNTLVMKMPEIELCRIQQKWNLEGNVQP